jgi:hypothetical protein
MLWQKCGIKFVFKARSLTFGNSHFSAASLTVFRSDILISAMDVSYRWRRMRMKDLVSSIKTVIDKFGFLRIDHEVYESYFLRASIAAIMSA